MKIRYSSYLLVMFLVAVSCRKDTITEEPPAPDTLGDKIKDSTIAISRDIYLWNSQIPDNFDARSYAGPEEIMDAIREFSTEPGFNDPVDHYSFAMKKDEWDNVSAGVTTDFGMNVFFKEDGDLRVRSIEPASAAGIAGVRRGWRLVNIAGSDNITIDNTDFIIENVYNSSATAFTFQKPDGTRLDIRLSAATYQEHPVFLDTIYAAGSAKAGYIVFNSFLGDTAEVNQQFKRVFNRFAAENVTDVIVDLRYNGGGYVNLQENLANYLVKPSVNGSIMMTQEYNEDYKDLNETTRFRKLGSLNVNNIYFIVTDNTASASELLINNLKPYMNVKLVGEPTYGKPVGFFPIDVADFYVFPVSFRSTNGQGVGNYFDGIQVDQTVADGVDKDWGDIAEPSLAAVLRYLATGSFALNGRDPGLNSVLDTQVKENNMKLNRKAFKGAVETR